MTSVLHYIAAAVTDRGRKRPSNEDAFGYSIEHGAFVLCDGMGGAAAGEIASAIAVDEVLAVLCARPRGASLQAAGGAAVEAANRAIYTQSQRNEQLNGMGTTMVALVAEDHRVCIVNVGDSRCYRLHRGRLQQVTLDHSVVEEQVRMGRMTPVQAERSPMRNMITRALGTLPSVTPDFFPIDAEPDDQFLLCSDGLTRELTNMTIQSLLTLKGSVQERCSRLVEAAKKAGGQDNITCVLVQATA
ncbi:MAG: Stp1/IreP family PP2C-type Ser/Thr phosphatase [Acidobacteriota bacterium]